MRIRRRVLMTLTVVAVAALNGAFSQSFVIDLRAYPEPPLPPLPAAGGKLIDPVFGTTIMRLTDANDGSDCQDEYSYWPSFNLDNTYVQAQCSVNGRMATKIWSFDPVAFTRGGGFTMNVRTPSGWPISPSDAIWSGVDPNVLFGHPVNAQTINATNVITGSNIMLVDLARQIPSGGAIDQMTKSIDDDVFAFNVNDSSGSRYGYVVWRYSTNSIVLYQQDRNVDEVEVDKTGRYLTVVHTDGSDRIWDLITGTATDLGWNSTDEGFFHHDAGHGSLFTGSWPNGLAYRPLWKPRAVTNLLNFPSTGQDLHFSMLADDEHWALVSRYSNSKSGAQAAFENEIFEVATDGSGRVRRLAHHRSVFNDYYDSPRANISRDGRYAAFVSNWGAASGRRDVFLLQIPSPAPVLAFPLRRR